MAYVTYVKFYQPGFAIPSRLKTMSTLPYLAVLPSWRRALPLAAASLLALSLAGCNSDAADAVAAPPPTVSVAPVSVRKIVLWDEFNGRVEAVESVALRPRVSGYIDRVNYEEGQIVKRGDVLFEIDARSYRAALARAEADLARARTQAPPAVARGMRHSTV